MPVITHWSTVNPMPTPRFDTATVAMSTKNGHHYVYAFGGSYAGVTSDYLPLNHVDRYEPSTGYWEAVAPMPATRGGPAVAVANGLIYVIGGFDRSLSPLRTMEAYDPENDRWISELPQMPTARMHLGAATGSDGRIYAIGGAVGSNAPLGIVEAYDPIAKQWATVASLKTPRYALAVVAASDGLIYAIDGATNASQPHNTVEAYDPKKDKNGWIQKKPTNTSRYNPAATVGQDGRIYVLGGTAAPLSNPLVSLNSVEIGDPAQLDPNGSGWVFSTPMPTTRLDLGSATDNLGRIYAIGGWDTGTLDTVEVYDAGPSGVL